MHLLLVEKCTKVGPTDHLSAAYVFLLVVWRIKKQFYARWCCIIEETISVSYTV